MTGKQIRRGDEIIPGSTFQPSDSQISMGDLAFAGHILTDSFENKYSAHHFSVCIASVAHLIARLVLSDRLIFLFSLDEKEDWFNGIVTNIEDATETLIIDQDHEIPLMLYEKVGAEAESMFGKELVENLQANSNIYTPWHTEINSWLTEYATSLSLKLPYAPNPFISQSIGLHSVQPNSTSEILTRYIEDLRREVAKEYNLLRGFNMYDLSLPLIFSAVLRESNKPSDILKVASQMKVDAKEFRKWCFDLDELTDPKKYTDKLRSAQSTLTKLGGRLGVETNGRMQISSPIDFGLDLKVPSPFLTRIINWLDVDRDFKTPRNYLLNLLSSAREIKSLSEELARVFGVPRDFADEAVNGYMTLCFRSSEVGQRQGKT